MPGHPETADRLAGDHTVEHHNNAWRHHDAQRAACLNNARNHALVISALEHFRHGDGCADGHARDAQAVHGGNGHHQNDRTDGKAAGQRPHPDVEHAVKVVGDARFREHVAHVDKQGQRDHGEPLHQRDAGVERHLRTAGTPQKEGRDGSGEADGCKHPLSGEHEHAHGCEEHQGNALMRKSERKIEHVLASFTALAYAGAGK